MQEATPVGPVFTTGQVVAVQEFPELAGVTAHAVTGVGPVVTVPGQVIAVQEFPALAGVFTHEATPVGPVVTVLQVVVT